MSVVIKKTKKTKVQQKIQKAVGSCIDDFNLIEDGDNIMVAVSGGKDSITLLYILLELQKKAPIDFQLFAFTLDQVQPEFSSAKLEDFYQSLNVDYIIHKEDTYSIVTDKIEEDKTYCSLCSRLRRGILYKQAQKLGATKIALGHHSDDAFETLFLNLFYSGRLASMAPKLYSDDGNNIVIRPLMYALEKDISQFSLEQNFPIIPCNLCGNQENLHRQRIKAWLLEEEKKNPSLKASLKRALKNVQPEFLWQHKKDNRIEVNVK